MINERLLLRATFVALGLLLSANGIAQQSQPAQKTPKAAAKRVPKAAAPTFQAGIEPRAVDLLKGASARLAAARTMAFTAVVSYESPSRLGPPLVYSTKSQVVMQRPDKLKIVTLGDGPPSEFYYDGKSMMALAPAENLVAVADAPPTIDAALQKAYDSAAIYFPFTDVIVTDPYKDIADGLKTAFYIGQSGVVGNTTTDMVAYVTGDVFVQAWIGTQDKLPRRIYAVYLNDRTRLRHVLELSNWELDAAVPANAFVSASAASAARIAFEPPDAKGGPGMKPPPKFKPAKGQ
ncbi:DUF2092 domain-containing protein [Cupriavidus basilensis]